MHNKPITLTERQIIEDCLNERKSRAEMSELTGRHRKTISNEICINGGERFYSAVEAHKKAEERIKKGKIIATKNLEKYGKGRKHDKKDK